MFELDNLISYYSNYKDIVLDEQYEDISVPLDDQYEDISLPIVNQHEDLSTLSTINPNIEKYEQLVQQDTPSESFRDTNLIDEQDTVTVMSSGSFYELDTNLFLCYITFLIVMNLNI